MKLAGAYIHDETYEKLLALAVSNNRTLAGQCRHLFDRALRGELQVPDAPARAAARKGAADVALQPPGAVPPQTQPGQPETETEPAPAPHPRAAQPVPAAGAGRQVPPVSGISCNPPPGEVTSCQDSRRGMAATAPPAGPAGGGSCSSGTILSTTTPNTNTTHPVHPCTRHPAPLPAPPDSRPNTRRCAHAHPARRTPQA